METKERALWAATALRFIGSAASIGFMWSVIVVSTLDTLPSWRNLIALGLLGMAIGTTTTAELLARRFKQLVGDAPEWRLRLDRNTAISRIPEYLLAMQIAPAMLRLIFADTPYPWLGGILSLAGLGYLALAAWAGWELIRSEITLTRLIDRWTTHAQLNRARITHLAILWSSILLTAGATHFIPGQVLLIPGSIADVAQTAATALLGILTVIASWNMAVASLRLWQGNDRRVAG